MIARLLAVGVLAASLGGAVVISVHLNRQAAVTPPASAVKGSTTITLSSGAPAAPANGHGKPAITDSKDGQPILSVAYPPGLKVGQPYSGSVTITNSGSAPLVVTAWQSGLASPAPDLAGWASLTVYDQSLGQNVYNGTAAGFWTSAHVLCGLPAHSASCPKWAGGEAHTFQFTVVIPDGVNVNRFQGAAFHTTYQWAGQP